MNRRLLTDLEVNKIKKYLKDDGEKDVLIRSIVWTYRKYGQTIRNQLDLLEKMVAHYEATAAPGKRRTQSRSGPAVPGRPPREVA
jgi:hypothetical protein